MEKIFNRPAVWREINNDHWQYHAPGYAVYATIVPVKNKKGRWLWDVRVMFSCERPDRQRTKGVATTLEGAMRIVEIICSETGTCDSINKASTKVGS